MHQMILGLLTVIVSFNLLLFFIYLIYIYNLQRFDAFESEEQKKEIGKEKGKGAG